MTFHEGQIFILKEGNIDTNEEIYFAEEYLKLAIKFGSLDKAAKEWSKKYARVIN